MQGYTKLPIILIDQSYSSPWSSVYHRHKTNRGEKSRCITWARAPKFVRKIEGARKLTAENTGLSTPRPNPLASTTPGPKTIGERERERERETNVLLQPE
jgi:hypothetical protein